VINLLGVTAITLLLLIACMGDFDPITPKENPVIKSNCETEPDAVQVINGMFCPSPYFMRGVQSISPPKILCSKILVECIEE